MKRLLCFILSVCLLASATVLSVSATDGDAEEVYAAPVFYGVQFASGSTTGTQNIRFVSVVPNGNGTAVGYEIFAKYTDGTEKYVEYSVSKNDTVMETNQLYAEVKTGGFGSKTATELGDELNMTSPYGLMAIAINGVPADQEIRFYVRTYVKEGDEVKAEAIFTGFVVNGATAETISASDEWHNQGGFGTADYPYVLTQANFEAFYTHYKYGGSNAFAADQHFSLETDVTLNTVALTGNTVVNYGITKGWGRFIVNYSKGQLNFTSANTVTFNYTATSTVKFLIQNAGAGTVNALTNFKAKVNFVEGVVALITTASGKVTADSKIYNPATVVSDLPTTEFKVVKMGVTNSDGASIKLPANETEKASIRFVAKLNETFKTELGTSATYGHVVTTGTDFAAAIGTIKTSSANSAFVWYDDTTYGVALNNISDYTKTYKVTAYVTITYADNSTATFYATYTDANNARSVVDVAQKAIASGDYAGTATETALQAIVNSAA